MEKFFGILIFNSISYLCDSIILNYGIRKENSRGSGLSAKADH